MQKLDSTGTTIFGTAGIQITYSGTDKVLSDMISGSFGDVFATWQQSNSLGIDAYLGRFSQNGAIMFSLGTGETRAPSSMASLTCPTTRAGPSA